MRSRMWIAAVVGISIVSAACSQQGPSPVEDQRSGQVGGQSPIAIGETAPAFALRSAEGGTVSLSDYSGKPVLLYFSMGPG